MLYTIWLTTQCNLQCLYCYEGENKRHFTLSKETADSVFNYIKHDFVANRNDNELFIAFHGGEPLINYPILKYLVDKFENEFIGSEITPIFQIVTNATLLTNEYQCFLAKHFKDITVSIDGEESTHDAMRPFKNGNGSYDITLKNSIEMLSKFPDLRVRMTFDPVTVHNLFENVIHLVKLGFKLIVPLPNLFDKNWTEKSFDTLKNEIEKIRNYVINDDVIISICDPLLFKIKCKCSGGINEKSIYSNGDIYPCVVSTGIEEFKIGNIWDGIDKNCLNNILKNSNPIISDCIDCLFYDFCNGTRCRIINKIINDDFLEPSVVECNLNNILYEVNGFVSDN